MEIVQGIMSTYAQFFNLEMWKVVLTNPVSWGLIGSLIILEGLLSADNALVLAVMVKHLPEKQRKKSLFYGVLGAYAFRFFAIGLGVYLVNLTWIKVVGAIYLAWIVISNVGTENSSEEESKGISNKNIAIRLFGQFWGTICMVEIMDIAFSVDSVLAAFGISNQVWVLLLGGIIGILMMRAIAGVFLKLLETVPELESTAYFLIAVIAVKMMASVFGMEMSQTLFFIVLVVAFLVTFIVHGIKKRRDFSAVK